MTFALALDLFRWSILSCLAVGVIGPLLGVLLLLRRTGIYGLVLPQFASLGVALGYAVLPFWIARVGLFGMDLEEALADPHALLNFLLVFVALCTAGGLVFQALFAGSRATETARAAGAFVVAGAATIMLAQASPLGAELVESLVRGEVLAVDVHEFETLAVALTIAGLLVWRLRRGFLIAGFDPETARVLQLPVRRYEWSLLAVTGLVVAVGTLIVGPMVLFAMLVLPPLAARRLASSMRSLFVWAIAIGVAGTLLGLTVSFTADQPLGPSIALCTAVFNLVLAPVRPRVPFGA